MGCDGLKKRGLVFFFYDKQGIVDRYVPFMLRGMQECVEDIYIVVNGELTEAGCRILEEITPHVWQRENKGFDVGAYIFAMRKIGWDKLAQYEEIILMNHTVMGPVCPVQVMFDEMSKKDVDFWGLSMHYKIPFDPYKLTDCGYIKEHLQSHFLAIRKSLLRQEDFRKYWEELPEIKGYAESVVYHESEFTSHFSELGYRWACYTTLEGLEDFTLYPLLKAPVKLLKEAKCPFFKRRSFFHDYEDYLNDTIGEEAADLMEYLGKETWYDTDMIWENLLRSTNQADLKKCLQLNYILDSRHSSVTEETVRQHKTALFYHVYYLDLLEECLHYASSMPPGTDIYVTTGSEEKKLVLEEKLAVLPNKVTVLLINNRGRDVSALLVGLREIVGKYEYICFVHDKKVGQLKPFSQGASWSYQCFENLLPSQPFVKNVIGLFEENPRLGILTLAPPLHGEYYPTLCYEWAGNYEHVVELAEKLKLHVPIEKKKEPVAAIGSMFWFRTAALRKLFAVDWKYEDFPEEPLPGDGTISHAIERIHSFVAQDAGYYPAWLFSDRGAALFTTNITYMLRGFNEVIFTKIGGGSSYSATKSRLLHSAELRRQDEIRMEPTLYCNTGNGYTEAERLYTRNTKFWPKLEVEFSLEKVTGNICGLRFDPCERGLFVLKGLEITAFFPGGREIRLSEKTWKHNGKGGKRDILFLSSDPWIDIKWKEKENPERLQIHAIVSTRVEDL